MGSRGKKQNPKKIRKPIPQIKDSLGGRLGAHDEASNHGDEEPPIFSLEHMVKNFCITGQEKSIRASFSSRIRRLSKSTWRELRLMPRKNGYEKIPDTNIKQSIPSCRVGDIPIISFRCGDPTRLIGYRNKRIFYILWVDASPFKVYDHS